MGFTCEKCGWWTDVNGVCVCGYSGRPTVRHDSCMAWKTTIVTNADRIRHMTDEEMARWIDEFWSAAWCPDDPPVDPETKDCLMHDGNCELCILDWLKQDM